MTQEKDFSLLRPFDLEAAKAGNAIQWGFQGATPCRFVGVSDHEAVATNIIEHKSGLSYAGSGELSMKPLCWVEGKPVYRGDSIYKAGEKREVHGIFEHDGADYLILCPYKTNTEYADNRRGYLSWTAPTIKREGWINVVRATSNLRESGVVARNAEIFPDEESAKKSAARFGDVIATVPIQWEEPAGGAK